MWYEGYELRMKNRRKRRRRDRRRRVSPLSPYNPRTQSVKDPTVSEGDHTQRLPVTHWQKKGELPGQPDALHQKFGVQL